MNIWSDSKFIRRLSLFFIDNILCLASMYFAFQLRFSWNVHYADMNNYWDMVPFLVGCRSLAFLYCGFYTRFWEYSSLDDLKQIVKSAILGSFLILGTLFFYNRADSIYRSIVIIDLVLVIMFLGGSRLIWRMWRETSRSTSVSDSVPKKKVLIFGTGDAGAALLRSLRTAYPHYQVVGFLDDDPRRFSYNLMGVKVLGGRHKLPEIVKALSIKELLIADNSISSESLRQLVAMCNQEGLLYKIVPAVLDLGTNEVHISKIRSIEISDLLGRKPVSLDLSSISKLIQGKRVLVTGAGGSIGSELCQQILEYQPSSLVMVDRGENYLYELGNLLGEEPSHTKFHFVCGSITNKRKMEWVFTQHQPHLVFHAAAHKHVPLMEQNEDECVLNNVSGTRIIAELSMKHGVQKFVLVSTDKVVRPTSTMGMTKNIAEQMVQYLDPKSETHFMTVRFGNVLGSKGSVVPLFQSQIERGGPVTITDPRMTRYFMMIPEAVQLILQAAAIGEGSEIFILDMGEPVKILDLAERMITLSGFQPHEDIEIKTVGVRPGEKLFEELMLDDDQLIQTFHKKIKILKSQQLFEPDFEDRLNELIQAAGDRDFQAVRSLLVRLIRGEHTPSAISLLKETGEGLN